MGGAWANSRAGYRNVVDLARRSSSTRVPQTTRIEHALLFLLVCLNPVANLVSIGQVSVALLLAGVVGLYVVFVRHRYLVAVVNDRVFMAGLFLIASGAIVESVHRDPSYGELLRITRMFGVAAFIGAMVRDRRGAQAVMLGYLVTGLLMAGMMFLTMYTPLSAGVATGFDEATRLRSEVAQQNVIAANLNGMAFLTGQGAVVCLAFALTGWRPQLRCWAFAVCLFLLAATCLPMSRSGLGIAVVSGAAVLRAARVGAGKFLGAAVLASLLLLLVVPSAVWARMTVSVDRTQSDRDARTRIYWSAVRNFPEYGLLGVGRRNFWENWGYQHGFQSGADTIGAHNCIIQFAIYWGLCGLVGILLVIGAIGSHLLRIRGPAPECLAALGIGLSSLILIMVTHQFFLKELSAAWGLLIAGRRWNWTPRHPADVSSIHPTRLPGRQ